TKMPLLDPDTNEEVSRSTCPKGYECAKGEFIVFTPEEIKSLDAVKNNCIEIQEFVEAASVDLIHIEKSYYVKPDKGGDKGYKLLSQVMKDKNVAAIATWVSRGKEHLVMVRSYRGGLLMHQLYYKNEVRDFEDNCAAVTISDVETKIAGQLIAQHTTGALDVSKYRDHYIDRVLAAVEQKKAGGEINIETTAPGSALDTLAAMQAMLDGNTDVPPVPEKPKKTKKASKKQKK
ncbi:MAG TPA: Ku protein, partial [Desulfosporosinus sp.]|nr:Ku protein [Desulfosporosinus sp.]